MCVLFRSLPTRTDCCFSPDDKLLVTGTSVKKNEGNGKLVFFDRASFQKVYQVEVTNAVSTAALSTTVAPPDNGLKRGGGGMDGVYNVK